MDNNREQISAKYYPDSPLSHSMLLTTRTFFGVTSIQRLLGSPVGELVDRRFDFSRSFPARLVIR